MSYIEPGTWEEQADHCYRIVYSFAKVTIVKVCKSEDSFQNEEWDDSTINLDCLTELKFTCKANAVHYLRQFTQLETEEPTLLSLLTSIKEFINSEPFPLTNCLDYIEL
jgi:hypothetical protein